MVVRNLLKPSAYFDSVTLMLVQREVRQFPGVEDAGAVMGTHANKELLRDAGLLTPEAQTARPDDLILSVRAASDAGVSRWYASAEVVLSVVFFIAAMIHLRPIKRAAKLASAKHAE